MRVCAISLDIKLADPAYNHTAARREINSHPFCDIYILPEFFATGFVSSPPDHAQPHDGQTVTWMRETARQTEAAVCGSVLIKESGYTFNRFYFVTPSGEAVYSKIHLFGHEKECETAGSEQLIINYRSLQIQPLICYDLRFPALSRTRSDLIVYVANWPQQRAFAWNQLLIARAIENQCYVVGCNRVGSDEFNSYAESTAVIDYLGAKQDNECRLDTDGMKKFRTDFRALDDQDEIELKGITTRVVDLY